MDKTIKFTLPSLPPSVNSLYAIYWRERRVELKPEARRYKSDMQTFIPRYTLTPGAYLHLDMEFHYPYLYQNLKLRVFDAPNMQKLLQDAVAQKLGIDDKHIKDWSGRSVDDEREYVVVTLSEVANG